MIDKFYVPENFFLYKGTLFTTMEVLVPSCLGCELLPMGSYMCAQAHHCTAAFRRDNKNVVWRRANNKQNYWAKGKVTELKALANKEIPNE